MLKHVAADGFRSLDQFNLEIRPGLNVLVGPNGGGKTNILALFSFISELSNNEIGNAISSAGGASKVFKKVGPGQFCKELHLKVKGEMQVDRTLYLPSYYERQIREAGIIGLSYEWNAEIDAKLGYDEPFYTEQHLRVRIITKETFTEDNDTNWHFEVSSHSLDPRSVSTSETIHDFVKTEMLLSLRQRDNSTRKQHFEIDHAEAVSLPLFMSVDNSYVLRRISNDLKGGTTFNFDPSICKLPNDSAQAPVLERNGAGLAATVYAIQKINHGVQRPATLYSQRKRFNSRAPRTLQEFFQLVNPAILGVRAENNTIDNKITLFIEVESSEQEVDFPLELASDGTVKWLAFSVALLTEENGFSVEEPENFLHPDIQRQAVELVRSETFGSTNLFVLMTTHSESLLNAARPEEIIIVSMENGVTKAQRIENPQAIDTEIYKTGFGLGYFYISGALNG